MRFRFLGPRGLHGFHQYTVHPVDADHTVLRHTRVARLRGPARLCWPLAFRWTHDACVETGLDEAERARTGTVGSAARWSRYVRLLRRFSPG